MDKYCRHGHEYTPENSYVHNGVVQCKECRRVNRNKSYRKYNLPVAPEVRWPKKTHCKHGHELTDENTRPCKGGGRRCMQCARDRANVRQKRIPNRVRQIRGESQRRCRYGRSYNRDEELSSQGNACAICGRTGLIWGKGYKDVWHTDHEHDKPGTHRGILCATCNTALGKLEPHIIKVIQYLVKYNKTELIKFLEGISNGTNFFGKNFGHDGLGQEVQFQQTLSNR